MRKASLLAAIPALLVTAAATSRCNPVDQGTDPDNHSTRPVRLEPAAQKALATVSTVHDHQMVQRAGERVVYHPGWSSRIKVVDAGGRHREIYQQTGPYHGSRPREAVLGFRDVALTVFDPNHRIAGIKVKTLDGEVWSLDDLTAVCPPNCPEGTDPPPTPSPSLAPMTAPLDHARLALAPAERARASVSTGPEHRVAQAAGERVTYHPGWSSRIARRDAAGRRQQIYRQTRPYQGSHPGEVVLGFDDVALALFDPNHRIAGIRVETVDQRVWSLDDRIWICTLDCPPPPEEDNP
jgi:hypothetical protein